MICTGSRERTLDPGHALGTCQGCGRLVVIDDDQRAYVHNAPDEASTGNVVVLIAAGIVLALFWFAAGVAVGIWIVG